MKYNHCLVVFNCNFLPMLWPGCHNFKVRRFSQGLLYKTPLRTHSKKAMLFPSDQASPNPWTDPIPKMPGLIKWKRDTDLALLGVQREFFLKSKHRINQNASNPALDSKVQVRFQGYRDADEVEVEGIGFLTYFLRGEFRHVRTQH
jgi:hypothetical protein